MASTRSPENGDHLHTDIKRPAKFYEIHYISFSELDCSQEASDICGCNYYYYYIMNIHDI